jgi:hypothetical protein
MKLLPINEENFTPEELLVLEKELSQIPKEEFNKQSLQVRTHLMSKQNLKNLKEGWEEKKLKDQSTKL